MPVLFLTPSPEPRCPIWGSLADELAPPFLVAQSYRPPAIGQQIQARPRFRIDASFSTSSHYFAVYTAYTDEFSVVGIAGWECWGYDQSGCMGMSVSRVATDFLWDGG